MRVKKYLFVLAIPFVCSCLFSNQTFAQKNAFNLSFSNLKVKESYWFEKNLLNLGVEYNRNLTKYFGIGGYMGVGVFEEWSHEKENNLVSSTFEKYSSSFHYGLNGKFHILPFVLKEGVPRFDIYIAGNVGLITINSSEGENITPAKGNYLDYSLMGGGAFYLTKKFGLFVEAGYKNYKYNQGFNARYGLVFRF
ncbi:MAG TPA: hypothetical protein PL017_13940 [Tenuifilaceae bacterium]|nr:hypothetical protein [Tenuifilaceae bacterium]